MTKLNSFIDNQVTTNDHSYSSATMVSDPMLHSRRKAVGSIKIGRDLNANEERGHDTWTERPYEAFGGGILGGADAGGLDDDVVDESGDNKEVSEEEEGEDGHGGGEGGGGKLQAEAGGTEDTERDKPEGVEDGIGGERGVGVGGVRRWGFGLGSHQADTVSVSLGWSVGCLSRSGQCDEGKTRSSKSHMLGCKSSDN
ncbi:hypothetical protein MLD38_006756 [Melastoma candidum]|uniref:Uncharacterized protein n=1 Tax=Melastoma candidum TaxID=119954 RepID=A0ACB9RN38_9MYRT|nr:hypothetical protein MLD38_006756 [Melastoma candidum]